MIKVIISGGGTGGHVFPAIAIADAVRKLVPDSKILFIGALGKLEMEKVPAAGYEIVGLDIMGFQRKLTLKNMSFPFKLIASLNKADKIIRKFDPDVVVGVGGYASGPTLRIAARKRIPTLIQEQNSYPGITNKLLGPKVSRICVAYEGMERFFPQDKIILTGNPVRQDILMDDVKREEGILHFGLQKDRKTILVMGGSLGAGTINDSLSGCIKSNITDHNLQFIWQTGRYYYHSISSDPVLSANPNVRIHAFLERMDLAYNVADLIVSRAGAIAISELCLIGRPVILIPSPNVAEDHQTKNARSLSDKGAAVLLRDADARKELLPAILSLAKDNSRQLELSRNIKALGIQDAADRIAQEAMSLIKRKSN